PWPARDRRLALAADDDGAGFRQGLPRRHSAACPLLQPVLARSRYRLGCAILDGVLDGSRGMSHSDQETDLGPADTAPGYERLDGHEIVRGIGTYLIGLGLATLLTIVSFLIARPTLVWQTCIPVGLLRPLSA